MQSWRGSNPVSLPMICLALVAVISTTTLVSAAPRDRAQLFTTCWGWGASCTMHSAVGRAYPPLASRPVQRVEPVIEITHDGIPSMVTSGTWEPGTMGKRGRILTPRVRDLLAVLLKDMADNDLAN